MSQLIQIGNLDSSVDNLTLQRLFERYGTVKSSKIAQHYTTGNSTGVGFIEMESHTHGDAAIAALNHLDHVGHIISVCWSECTIDHDAEGEKMFGPMNIVSEAPTQGEINRE